MAIRDTTRASAVFLSQEMQWLQQLIDARFKLYFASDETEGNPLEGVQSNEPLSGRSNYEDFLLQHEFGFRERVALALALAPHLHPAVLDAFHTRNAAFDRRFTEFGGVAGTNHGGFLPTGETLLFLLAGDDLEGRFAAQSLFDLDHVFARESILTLARSAPSSAPNEPRFSGRLVVSEDLVEWFCRGKSHGPTFSTEFPAKLVSTDLNWEDVVLGPSTLDHLTDIHDWLEYGDQLRNDYGLGDRLRPGYTSLFYGPPGTGKTLTACLLGKDIGRDVYRIDLSMVVSKWIGETEKNLARVFDQAEGKGWILFFDEADALFGKRTETRSSNDRFANQEVSYLLQRIEDFDGLAILASNMKEHIDKAFTRRFQSIVHFPIPNADERLRLWRQSFPPKMALEESIDLRKIADRHEIAGGVIVNVVRYCAIKALKRGNEKIQLVDLEKGLEKELVKEGFFLN